MKARGFTLIEILFAMVVLGALSIIMSPFFKLMMTAKEQSFSIQQAVINQKIANAMTGWAKQADPTGKGRLPSPYTNAGTKYYNAPCNPTLTGANDPCPYIAQQGVSVREINNEERVGSWVRVYQLVPGLSFTVPLYFSTGPQVSLAYDFGVVYMTTCTRQGIGTACNPNAVTGVPGASKVMTASTSSGTQTPYSSWQSEYPDYPSVAFSTLQLQKDMLQNSTGRLDKIRDAFSNYFRSKVLSSSPNDPTNWYPSGSASMGGQAPTVTNQWCRDGWYNLSTDTVLDTIGLTTGEFGKTAWGGTVEYCRDYDPQGTNGANAMPHFAAIRINKNVSQGINPDASTPANNILLSF